MKYGCLAAVIVIIIGLIVIIAILFAGGVGSGNCAGPLCRGSGGGSSGPMTVRFHSG
jgi:hypothetical protein